MLDVSRSDLVAGVAGCGTMGRGIAQVLAQSGVRTLIYDAQPGAAQRGLDSIAQALARLAEKGRVSDPQSITRRISRSARPRRRQGRSVKTLRTSPCRPPARRTPPGPRRG